MTTLKNMMKIRSYAILFLALLALAAFPVQHTYADSGEAEVRGVVSRVFEQLKSGQYDSLYEMLPNSSREKMSRERFTSALKRTRDMYDLDRLEIGKVHVAGDLAVVDTVMYGRVHRPAENEGKIVAQQYLVREDGKWRVATGDQATVKRFLAANPTFARQFKIRQPAVFIKKDGRWIDLTAALRAMRQRA
ncbi:MAG: hypothetical protein WCB68_14535 [Pyrinomonadaceae bacterium]